ncbi:hydroxymethylglutaryl-CoA synthase, partial [Candidatus Peregrinibacteria bacterium]|nr:hydroxymethylglutaryl-CoA synthase [Candidatus Peregrinibacteria bacterium]
RYRIRTEEIAKHWNQDPKDIQRNLGVIQKTVPGPDEDSFTMAFEAGKQAIEIAGIHSSEISAIFVGSESHPYAVKPTSSMLVAALELHPFCHCADLEFACKAGTAAMQIIDSMVRAKQIEYGVAIGTDTAQARPGDALEYTAAAGAAAIVLGHEKSPQALCRIDATLSFATDTPDFWRAAGEKYPSHAGRFTGEPGYFTHVRAVLKGILETNDYQPATINHVVLHMPNAKFPKKIAKEFGFTEKQWTHGFIVQTIGNTYSACSLLGLCSVLERAKKDENILMVSYGSGAGADAFLMTMLKDGVPLPTDDREMQELSYSEYLQHTKATA